MKRKNNRLKKYIYYYHRRGDRYKTLLRGVVFAKNSKEAMKKARNLSSRYVIENVHRG